MWRAWSVSADCSGVFACDCLPGFRRVAAATSAAGKGRSLIKANGPVDGDVYALGLENVSPLRDGAYFPLVEHAAVHGCGRGGRRGRGRRLRCGSACSLVDIGYPEQVYQRRRTRASVNGCPQAADHMISVAMGGSIGASQGVTGIKGQQAARPCESELPGLCPAPARQV